MHVCFQFLPHAYLPWTGTLRPHDIEHESTRKAASRYRQSLTTINLGPARPQSTIHNRKNPSSYKTSSLFEASTNMQFTIVSFLAFIGLAMAAGTPAPAQVRTTFGKEFARL